MAQVLPINHAFPVRVELPPWGCIWQEITLLVSFVRHFYLMSAINDGKHIAHLALYVC